jgi:hypothetical protein
MADTSKKLSTSARAVLTLAATRDDHLARPPQLPKAGATLAHQQPQAPAIRSKSRNVIEKAARVLYRNCCTALAMKGGSSANGVGLSNQTW